MTVGEKRIRKERIGYNERKKRKITRRERKQKEKGDSGIKYTTALQMKTLSAAVAIRALFGLITSLN